AQRAQRPEQVPTQQRDSESIAHDEIGHRTASGLCAGTICIGSAILSFASRSASIRYLMAISTVANTSVQTSVNRKVASISGGSALFTTIGPGCWVRHHVTLKCTTGTSMNPKIPTTAASLAP